MRGKYSSIKRFRRDNVKQLIISFFLILTTNCTYAQQKDILDSALVANRHVFYFDGENFSGAGYEFLNQQLSETQFVLLAENHNTKEIPIFTTQLFENLHSQYGFNYLALEQDPIMMKLVSTGQYDVQKMALKYPNGFTFISDQELDMIESVIEVSKVEENAVWGLDQSFGVSHSIDFILSSFSASNEIKSLRDSIFSIETKRDLSKERYISNPVKKNDLLKIREAIPQDQKEDMSFYIESLLISNKIYGLYAQGKYYENGVQRESYMKRRFLEEYRKAQEQESQPKVVFKFGHYHLMNGFNTGFHGTNLGNFVREFAFMNNTSAIAINFQVYRDDGSVWDYIAGAYQIFANQAKVNEWTLFDLREIRSLNSQGKFRGFIPDEHKEEWRHILYRFDFILFMGNAGSGTWDITNVKY